MKNYSIDPYNRNGTILAKYTTVLCDRFNNFADGLFYLNPKTQFINDPIIDDQTDAGAWIEEHSSSEISLSNLTVFSSPYCQTNSTHLGLCGDILVNASDASSYTYSFFNLSFLRYHQGIILNHDGYIGIFTTSDFENNNVSGGSEGWTTDADNGDKITNYIQRTAGYRAHGLNTITTEVSDSRWGKGWREEQHDGNEYHGIYFYGVNESSQATDIPYHITQANQIGFIPYLTPAADLFTTSGFKLSKATAGTSILCMHQIQNKNTIDNRCLYTSYKDYLFIKPTNIDMCVPTNSLGDVRWQIVSRGQSLYGTNVFINYSPYTYRYCAVEPCSKEWEFTNRLGMHIDTMLYLNDKPSKFIVTSIPANASDRLAVCTEPEQLMGELITRVDDYYEEFFSDMTFVATSANIDNKTFYAYTINIKEDHNFLSNITALDNLKVHTNIW